MQLLSRDEMLVDRKRESRHKRESDDETRDDRENGANNRSNARHKKTGNESHLLINDSPCIRSSHSIQCMDGTAVPLQRQQEKSLSSSSVSPVVYSGSSTQSIVTANSESCKHGMGNSCLCTRIAVTRRITELHANPV